MKYTEYTLVIFFILFSTLILFSCSSTKKYSEQSPKKKSSEYSQSKHPSQYPSTKQSSDFFTCSRWFDRNQDGIVAWDEWEGVDKTVFRSYDDVTFVGEFQKPVGTIITMKLKSPDGEVYYEHTGPVVFEGAGAVNIRKKTFLTRDLINSNGVGIWRMEWFIEGALVGESKAVLIK